MRFVVTGCGRSGTKYVSHLLTAAGLDCGHEDVFNAWPGGRPPSGWRQTDLDGDSSYIAAPWTPDLRHELTVVHLVRAPLDHIRSVVGCSHVANGDAPWVRFIDSQIQLLRHHRGPVRAAAYWLRWNRLVDGNSHLFWRLHEIDEAHVKELADRIGASLDPERITEAVERTSKRLNHRRRDESVTLDDLGPLRDQVVEQAERYGLPLEVSSDGAGGGE